MVAMSVRSRLESGLGQSGRTVTVFLEQLVGEPIDAHERHHVMTQAGARDPLGVAEGHPVLQRSAVLRGRRSAKPYLRAHTLLVPSRLPPGFCRQLETSTDPIGRILVESGVCFTRAPLPPAFGPANPFTHAISPEDHLMARMYRVDVDGVAVMAIAEWFLAALKPFLLEDSQVSEDDDPRHDTGAATEHGTTSTDIRHTGWLGW
jgi:chorismate-pyruvate lyase